jgi:hypothetical protein
MNVTDDLLSSATEALRETSIDDDGAATRLRVRRSLEAHHRGRRQLTGFLTGTGILLAGTMSWAFVTGRAEAVWHAIVDPAPVYEERGEPERSALPRTRAFAPRDAKDDPGPQAAPEGPAQELNDPERPSTPDPAAPPERGPAPALPAEAPAPRAEVRVPHIESPVARATEATAPRVAGSTAPRVEAPAARDTGSVASVGSAASVGSTGTVVARVEAPAPPRAAAAAPRAADTPPSIEALYRRAHELHFHGADHAAAIAAWEAYLVAEPTGRFVAEARYNRALLLIRVGRYTEARAALAPYARGEIAGGYRRTEATQLIERLPDRDR